MPIIHLDGLDDPRLAAYSGMTDSQLRDCPDSANGLFIGESRKVIERALAAGVRMRSLFMEEKWLDQTMPVVERVLAADPEMPVFVATREQFHALTGYEVTRGALAAFERPALPSVEELVAGARRVAVLEDVVNYTNIGAVFRSAAAHCIEVGNTRLLVDCGLQQGRDEKDNQQLPFAAASIDAVLVTPSCHDPLYRRAARVSMGTVFQVPWTRIGSARDWAAEGVPLLRSLGFATAALALADDAIYLHDARLRDCERLALVLGTEGDGLAASTIAACDYTVKIPMDHDVDSLNVAAASAVAFWELRTKWR